MPDNTREPQMPLKATPYKHQCTAFAFACRLFGLRQEERQQEGGDEKCQKTKPSAGA